MSRLGESVRVFPDESRRIVTQRVGETTRRVELDVYDNSEKMKELNESHEYTRRVGSTWAVDSSLTSVDFRVWST